MSRLSNEYRYMVICEDRQMEIFVRRLLEEQGINVCRKVIFDISPQGECGEAYVRRNLPKYISLLHSTNYNRSAVIAFTDADTSSVINRAQMLVSEIENTEVHYSRESDCLMMLIPKRNIESWIKYFETGEADEDSDYGHMEEQSKCKPMAIRMSRMLKNGSLKQCHMSSLAYAQDEFDKCCSIQARRR